ncbi:MAG: PepSY domain-containing protein [Lewinella sp.]|uniref:PepSY domain-containing protein n=1 Tax=Lewinella sp. TaxID=2004506 RepID=UPI003D6AD2C5
MSTTRRQNQAKLLRVVRKIHRWTGASLFVVFLFVSITGLLLGWKKDSKGYLLPDTQKGVSTEATEWLPLANLQDRALFLIDSLYPKLDTRIDRLDVRPNKGIVKFTFENYYHELQLDLSTGSLLSSGKRRSDLLEHIHDGSIVDKQFGSSFFKLLYTTVAGLALLVFTVTGFWLWYGPKRMRK